LSYNYNSIYSRFLVCFTSDFAQPGLPACPGVSGLVQQASPFSSNVSAGFVDFLWTPVNRLSLKVGANLLEVTGSEWNLNPLSTIATAPAGPLNSGWYQPYTARRHIPSLGTGRDVPAGTITGITKIRTAPARICLRREISGATSLLCRCDIRFEKSEWRAIAFTP
jgi:hypothetical protein